MYILLEIDGSFRNGVLHVRKGHVIAATCGSFQGNGAFLSLVAMGSGDVRAEQSQKWVENNVNLTISQATALFEKMPGLLNSDTGFDEELTFQEAEQLFFQFKRKEAGEKLVKILQQNRFFYPAWLYHSRLMTRQKYIAKALQEANRWGGHDQQVQNEVIKIESELQDSQENVRRCLFCWSLVSTTGARCYNCQGILRLTEENLQNKSDSQELKNSLDMYQLEFERSPANTRIAYCLCLGYTSLGDTQKAWGYLEQAMKISPDEQLFVEGSRLLQPKKALVALSPIEEAEKKASSPISSQKTILVIEDSKTSRKVISVVVGRKGYNIIEASDGHQALQEFVKVVPDLVLLDVMLPDMTGYEVLARIRQSATLKDIPVVMLTGKKNSTDRMKGFKAGVDEYLTKPFDPAKLLMVLEKFLGNKPAPADMQEKKSVSRPAIRKITPKPKPVPKRAPKQKKVAAKKVNNDSKGFAQSILVVEDSPTTRTVVSMVLSKKGYDVQQATTGIEGLHFVREEPPHLILLDGVLPDMHGFDFLGQLQKDTLLKKIPVVMLTAKNSAIDRQKGFMAGCVDYLTKPFNPQKLLAVIGNQLDRSTQPPM